MPRLTFLLLAFFASIGLTFAALAAAGGQPPPPNDHGANADKVAVCHKPGTPAEKTLYVPASAVAGHLGHGDSTGVCGAPPTSGCNSAVSDLCIDGDGYATRQPGGFEVQIGDALASVPGFINGLDLFDRAPLGVLTQDDDLHVEDPRSGCTTALRNARHDLGLDCKVLDINGDLMDGEVVTADCDGGGCAFIFALKYHDKNGDGDYDPQDGEDLVRDTNANNIFD